MTRDIIQGHRTWTIHTNSVSGMEAFELEVVQRVVDSRRYPVIAIYFNIGSMSFTSGLEMAMFKDGKRQYLRTSRRYCHTDVAVWTKLLTISV